MRLDASFQVGDVAGIGWEKSIEKPQLDEDVSFECLANRNSQSVVGFWQISI